MVAVAPRRADMVDRRGLPCLPLPLGPYPSPRTAPSSAPWPRKQRAPSPRGQSSASAVLTHQPCSFPRGARHRLAGIDSSPASQPANVHAMHACGACNNGRPARTPLATFCAAPVRDAVDVVNLRLRPCMAVAPPLNEMRSMGVRLRVRVRAERTWTNVVLTRVASSRVECPTESSLAFASTWVHAKCRMPLHHASHDP